MLIKDRIKPYRIMHVTNRTNYKITVTAGLLKRMTCITGQN